MLCWTRTGRRNPNLAPNRSATDSVKEVQFLSKPENGPGQPAGPRSEWRVALLRIRAAITAVVQVENAFVRGAAVNIVGIALLAIENGVAGGCFRVVDEPLQQGNPLIPLAHEDMTELMTQ